MTGRESRETRLRSLGHKLLSHKRAFILNNVMRMREMLRYGSPGFRTVFETIPYYLQVNEPESPGYVNYQNPPRGIIGFEHSGFARLLREARYALDWKRIFVRRPRIQALMLMGSTGSIGQNLVSDLDYWVCVNKSEFQPEESGLLEEKLRRLSAWAKDEHQAEVHFFLMDAADISANRFGVLDEESSGDLMPGLLKEEFYRTVLHVAGRLPLWWTTPPDTDQAEYKNIVEVLPDIHSTTFQASDLIDLGFPPRPGPKEYLGGAMWQIYKSQSDPFKALLKMVLILEQAEKDLEAPLLCEQVKKAVLEAGPEELPLDPYLITIRRVLSFASQALDPGTQELVRLSAWFKLHSPLNPARPRESDPKALILEGLAREWAWQADKVEDMYGYQSWPDKKKLALGEEIKASLFELYTRVASRLRNRYAEELEVLEGNLAGLNARILARYARHETKVEDLPSTWHRRDLPQDLNLFHQDGLWQICDSLKPEDIIYSASRAARVAAWLIHNGLWGPSLRLRIRSGGTSLKLRNLSDLLSVLAETLPSREMHGLPGDSPSSGPAGPKVLVINLEEQPSETRIVTAEVIYRTDAGETRHEVLDCPAGTEGEKYLFLAAYFREAVPEGIDGLVIYVPSGRAEEVISANLKTAWRLFQKGKKEAAGPPVTSNLPLDKEDDAPPSQTSASPAPGVKARLDND